MQSNLNAKSEHLKIRPINLLEMATVLTWTFQVTINVPYFD